MYVYMCRTVRYRRSSTATIDRACKFFPPPPPWHGCACPCRYVHRVDGVNTPGPYAGTSIRALERIDITDIPMYLYMYICIRVYPRYSLRVLDRRLIRIDAWTHPQHPPHDRLSPSLFFPASNLCFLRHSFLFLSPCLIFVSTSAPSSPVLPRSALPLPRRSIFSVSHVLSFCSD